MFFKDLNHPGCDSLHGIDAVLPGNDVLLVGRDEADHLVVPGRFFEFLHDFGGLARHIVGNRHGLEILFDHFHKNGVTEDFGPKDLTTGSARNFLEEKENGFAGRFGRFQGLVKVPGPFDLAELDRLVGLGLAARQQNSENE